MSENVLADSRKRNKTLIVVEGNHEKNILFELIFRCFPEMSIDMENVWIYGTNIYILYQDIEKEYGEDWDDTDVDLPYVITKRNNEKLQYKSDFTDIILTFDYERHDPNYSEEKISKLQEYFTDSTDVGKLYINYPMIEAYRDLHSLPDASYEDRKIPVTMQPGAKYKAAVRGTVVDKLVNKLVEFPQKTRKVLSERFEVADETSCQKCVEDLLRINSNNNLKEYIFEVLDGKVRNEDINTAQCYFSDRIKSMEYTSVGMTYWEYTRDIFKQIIKHNICKAYKIQNSSYDIAESEYRTSYQQLDLLTILQIQNAASRDRVNGWIWVLSTCVFAVADYNFSLVSN
ncbi:MAG: hypothetical protein IJM37_04950 [Lachnospiraceae bacterium]|nr:hypothetical protein [Lachnospiraceae bacterium]